MTWLFNDRLGKMGAVEAGGGGGAGRVKVMNVMRAGGESESEEEWVGGERERV